MYNIPEKTRDIITDMVMDVVTCPSVIELKTCGVDIEYWKREKTPINKDNKPGREIQKYK